MIFINIANLINLPKLNISSIYLCNIQKGTTLNQNIRLIST